MARLTAELRQHLGVGVAHQIGACDADGRPCLCRGLAAVEEDDGRLSVLFSADAGFELIEAVRATRLVALVLARPTTHRSVQIKGDDAEVAMAEPRHWAWLEPRRDALARELAQYGFGEAHVDAWYHVEPGRLARITFTPRAAWDQTPGPGAGAPIALDGNAP
ncbi:MAG TPA: hypothetical protein VEY50_08770 [Lysobacter sp.]|nr:hypothetical protein [Lysobacter sp.]